jgi:hypothetical protein
MAKRTTAVRKNSGRKSTKRRAWSNKDHTELRRHSKAKTPVTAISRAMKRTVGALRQQARKLGLPVGHRR